MRVSTHEWLTCYINLSCPQGFFLEDPGKLLSYYGQPELHRNKEYYVCQQKENCF